MSDLAFGSSIILILCKVSVSNSEGLGLSKFGLDLGLEVAGPTTSLPNRSDLHIREDLFHVVDWTVWKTASCEHLEPFCTRLLCQPITSNTQLLFSFLQVVTDLLFNRHFHNLTTFSW